MIIIGAKDGRKKEVAKNRRHIKCLLTYKQQKKNLCILTDTEVRLSLKHKEKEVTLCERKGTLIRVQCRYRLCYCRFIDTANPPPGASVNLSTSPRRTLR
jgi:hypothetical protein